MLWTRRTRIIAFETIFVCCYCGRLCLSAWLLVTACAAETVEFAAIPTAASVIEMSVCCNRKRNPGCDDYDGVSER